MTLRDTLNEKPQIVTAAAIGIIAVATLAIIWQILRPGGPAGSSGSNQAFYSIDDGTSWFADDIAKVPPFEAHGGMAVRAVVYTCDGGQTKFVGYLERYPADVARQLAGRPPGSSPEDLSALGVMQNSIEVKRPGQTEWVPARRHDLYARVISVTCPDGSPPALVLP